MLIEKVIKLEKQEEEFVSQYAEFGFANPNEMIKKGLHLLKEKLVSQDRLIESAELYAELYDQDTESQEWVESAMQDWE